MEDQIRGGLARHKVSRLEPHAVHRLARAHASVLALLVISGASGCAVGPESEEELGALGEALSEPGSGCLDQARLIYFETDAHVIFDPEAATLEWGTALPPCDGLALRLNGSLAADFGSRQVSPAYTTTYSLTASYAGQSRTLGQITIVRVLDVAWIFGGRGGWRSFTHTNRSAAIAARDQVGTILEGMPENFRQRFVSRRLELHLVPANRPVTALPPFRHLAGEETWDGRPWEEVRGGGGVDHGDNRTVMFVGEETLLPGAAPHLPGHILAHEVGHTVLDAFHPNHDAVQSSYEDHVAAGRTCLVRDDYSCEQSGEWFAEGTAALFGYPPTSAHAFRYDEGGWLEVNNPELYQTLNPAFSER